MNCRACGLPANINVIYAPVEVWSCDEHFIDLYNLFLKSRRKVNVNLGQVADKWLGSDGKMHRMTVGKSWEIENRTITPEGQVVNKKTGRDPQY